MIENLFINITGLIGVGKTTLAEVLSKKLDIKACYEEVEENVILEKFYKDMKTWSFPLEMKLLLQRKRFHEKCSLENSIMDKSIYEDEVFARVLHNDGFINDISFDLLCDWYKETYKDLTKPTHIIYLDVNPEISLQRIKTRGRSMEQSIELEYLSKLNEEYKTFIKDYKPIVVDWTEFKSVEEITKLIL